VRGLLIGRFQPFHGGHLEVVRTIRSSRPSDGLLLGVGTAQESYTWKNPFTAGERLEMIARALDEAKITGCAALPIPDIQRHALWVSYLQSQLPPFDRVYTNNPLTQLLFERAHVTVENPPVFDRHRYEGERVREHLAADREWRSLVPPAVERYLEEIGAPSRLALLKEGEGRSSKKRTP
jgi:nicotinamide-nucleotide adenylyltransferase